MFKPTGSSMEYQCNPYCLRELKFVLFQRYSIMNTATTFLFFALNQRISWVLLCQCPRVFSCIIIVATWCKRNHDIIPKIKISYSLYLERPLKDHFEDMKPNTCMACNSDTVIHQQAAQNTKHVSVFSVVRAASRSAWKLLARSVSEHLSGTRVTHGC